MGNTWKGTSDESLQMAELALLKRAGLTEDEYLLHYTPLDEVDPENYIHCIEVKSMEVSEERRKTQPKMVLIHGYGAGACYFFKVMKDLAKHFHLYVVDLLGMGGSGRPAYECKTPEQAEEFFVTSLK